MAYADLTAEDQSVLQNWLNALRAWAGIQARANNTAAAIDTAYTGQVTAILAKFNTNEVVVNTSGLAGSQALNVGAEAVTIQSHIEGVIANYGTAAHRQLRAKASGLQNLIG